MKEKVVICTGGMDPLHSGHIKMFEAAWELGSVLVVGVNSDAWLSRKKGRPFLPFNERLNIVSNLRMVDFAYGFDDADGSASDCIRIALARWPDAQIIFANGGDRNAGNIPEMAAFANNPQVTFEFGVGGDTKANSSSWILNEWKTPRTLRPWGNYRNLHQDGPGTKVKELTVDPSASLSMQRHRMRNERWMCSQGQATVLLSDTTPEDTIKVVLNVHDQLTIPVGTWHQLINNGTEPCRIVEIQYGANCMEEDIERFNVAEEYGVSLYAK
jgi:cytidyltransferase-like protein